MKKFLVILMVVAMASFLFVGCFGTTPDIPDEDEEPAVAVTGVTLDQATLALTIGDAAVTLVATVAPADATNPRVTWASSAETVAIVALGVVTPLNAGISAITATTVDGGFVATCVLTVAAADEEEPVVITTVTPVIELVVGIDITSSATQYINAAEAAVVAVWGTAPTYSEVKIYIEDICAGTGNTDDAGVFLVVIAEADLGTDGAKTLYATATDVGLPESAHSVEYEFILDQVKPGISSVAATADRAFVNSSVLPVIATPAGTATVTATTFTGNFKIETGTWDVICTSFGPVGGVDDLQIISPSGTITTAEAAADTGADAVIPGLALALATAAVGDHSTVTVSALGAVTAIAGRATLKFDEDVSSGAANAGTYAITDITPVIPVAVSTAVPDVFKETNDTAYWTALALLVQDHIVKFTVSDVDDLAGNTITADSWDICIVGPAHLTSLAP